MPSPCPLRKVPALTNRQEEQSCVGGETSKRGLDILNNRTVGFMRLFSPPEREACTAEIMLNLSLSELDNKRVAVCYIYGDDGALFLHCAGTGKFENGDLLVDRGEKEDAFCVSGSWHILLRENPPDKRARLAGADYLVAIRIASRLQALHDKRMAILLWEGDKVHTLVGDCRYSDNTLCVHRGRGRKSFVVYRDWYPMIAKTSHRQARALDGAGFALSLRVGPLPPGMDESELWDVGIRLPIDDTTYVERSRRNDAL